MYKLTRYGRISQKTTFLGFFESRTMAEITAYTDLKQFGLERQLTSWHAEGWPPDRWFAGAAPYGYAIYLVDDMEYLASLAQKNPRNARARKNPVVYELRHWPTPLEEAATVGYFDTPEAAMAASVPLGKTHQDWLRVSRTASEPRVTIVAWCQDFSVHEVDALEYLAQGKPNPRKKQVQRNPAYRLELHRDDSKKTVVGYFSSIADAQAVTSKMLRKEGGTLLPWREFPPVSHYGIHNSVVFLSSTWTRSDKFVGVFRLYEVDDLEYLGAIQPRRKAKSQLKKNPFRLDKNLYGYDSEGEWPKNFVPTEHVYETLMGAHEGARALKAIHGGSYAIRKISDLEYLASLASKAKPNPMYKLLLTRGSLEPRTLGIFSSVEEVEAFAAKHCEKEMATWNGFLKRNRGGGRSGSYRERFFPCVLEYIPFDPLEYLASLAPETKAKTNPTFYRLTFQLGRVLGSGKVDFRTPRLLTYCDNRTDADTAAQQALIQRGVTPRNIQFATYTPNAGWRRRVGGPVESSKEALWGINADFEVVQVNIEPLTELDYLHALTSEKP